MSVLSKLLASFFLVAIPVMLYSQPLDSLRFHQRYDSIETLNFAGKYDEALQLSQNLYEQCISEFGEKNKFTAFASLALGVAYLNHSQFGEAENIIKQCIETRKQLFGDDYIELPAAYNALGSVYSESLKPHKAIPLFEEALRILRLHFPPDSPNFAQTLNNLGIAYDLTGEYELALKMHRQSLSIKKANPKASVIQLSNTYNNIAAVYLNTGDLENSIENYEHALGLLEQHELQNSQEYVLALMNLGVVWFQAKNNFLSKKYLDAANERAEAVFGKNHFRKGTLQMNLGVTFIEMGELEKAEALISEAMDIFQQNFGEGSFFDMACSIALGHIWLKREKPDSSLVFFKNAYDIGVNNLGESNTQTIMALNTVGAAYDRMGNFNHSINIFRQAIADYEKKFNEINQPVVPTLDYLDAQTNLANMLLGEYVKHQNPDLLPEIQTGVDNSFSIFETMKYQANDQLTRRALVTNSFTLFELAIKAATFQDTIKAFWYSEQAKSGELLLTISEQNSIRYNGVPDSLLQRERLLKNRIAYFEKHIAESIDHLDFDEVIDSRHKLDSLKLKLGELKQLLKSQNPNYHDLNYNLSTITVEDVQRVLLRPNEALLEYFVGDSSIFIFVIKKDFYHVEEIKKDFPLEAWVDTLRHNIYQNRSSVSDSYVQAATDLYDKLVRPVAGLLPERLIVIPDGVLGYVPFDALLTGRPKDLKRPDRYDYLLKKHQISYCYSATLLKKMRERRHRHAPAREFVAFSPYYTGSLEELEYLQPFQFSPDSLYAGLRSYTPEWSTPLKATGNEVNTLHQMIGGDVFYGSDATEALFDSIAGQYRVVHLATHGIADNRAGDYSFLAFHILPDSTENELLYVRDLYNLELNADMVVLSACETGLGELQRGEGIISLARAFAYAGAKSIVNTLWKVDDNSTSELMVGFYKYLKDGKDKDEALRLAKLAYLKQHGKRAMPFFWAGVIPVGDMGAVWAK